MTDARTFVTTDSRGQHFVVTEADTLDAAQLSGRWLKTTTPVPVRR